jgi:hypothetical protein
MWRIFYRTKRKDVEAQESGEEYVFHIKEAKVFYRTIASRNK